MSHTLYLEADEDITSAIDKLNKVEDHEVRVVVPKRSTLLASVINLKLLKKASADAKKKLVLITTDATVISIASRVGLAVADNIKAEAEIPKAEEAPATDHSEVIEEDDPEPESTPEPELPAEAAAAPAAFSRKAVGEEEPVAKPAKKKKGSRLPDFNGFHKKIALGAVILGVLLLIFGLNFFFKKADIIIFAKGAQFPTDVTFKAVEADSNPEAGTVESEQLTQSEQLSGEFPATGKKDIGTKASGTITVTNNCYNPGTLPAGTGFNGGGKRFVSTQAVAIPAAQISSGSCGATTAAVPVTADANGDSYNLAPTSFTVGSAPSSGVSYLRGQGGQMSGGTSKVVEVVTQGDIDKALKELIAKKTSIKEDLAKKAGSEQIVVADSISSKASSQSASPAADAEGSSFTLNATVDFKVTALKKADLEELIMAELSGKLGADNQIYDTGLTKAEIKPTGKPSEFSLSTDVYAGPKIEIEKTKDAIKGKKLGEASAELGRIQGVDRTEVNLWPFWVTTVPRLGNRINIDIKVDTPGS